MMHIFLLQETNDATEKLLFPSLQVPRPLSKHENMFGTETHLKIREKNDPEISETALENPSNCIKMEADKAEQEPDISSVATQALQTSRLENTPEQTTENTQELTSTDNKVQASIDLQKTPKTDLDKVTAKSETVVASGHDAENVKSARENMNSQLTGGKDRQADMTAGTYTLQPEVTASNDDIDLTERMMQQAAMEAVRNRQVEKSFF